MNHFNPQSEIAPSVLATDLDGTLIPLPNTPDNNKDLIILKKSLVATKSKLVYVTGRHFESAIDAIEQYDLPAPDWIVCDVGSAIYRRDSDGYHAFSAYERHVAAMSSGVDRQVIEDTLSTIEGLELQPIEHQQRFKTSYQSSTGAVQQLVDRINIRLKEAKLPYNCMGSLDPFLSCGLLDVMPSGISKAYALIWLSKHANFHPDEVIYSGDSGNDYAALVSGFRAIIVANGSPALADKVSKRMHERGLPDRLYLARSPATSGVLEGCRHFGLFHTAS